MAIDYPVELSITLKPVQQPWIKISVADQIITTQLKKEQTFDLEFLAQGSAELCVEHFDKSDLDPDTAVEITAVRFFGVENPKFIWAGTYCPQYPPHLVGNQSQLPGQSYLSWNGVWHLRFDLPVFVWMHQTLDWGWLYD